MSDHDQWLLVRVTDMSTGRQKVSVKIPVSLFDFGIKMAARFAPDSIEGLDMERMIEVMKKGGGSMLGDVEDKQKVHTHFCW